jgi:tRNA(Ile)-lysidine synthetase-like protein
MNTSQPPLIVAVSGGIDSVVMLHVLATLADGEQYKVEGIRYKGEKHPELSPRYPLLATLYSTSRQRLVVAHAEHGMRSDSAADARFVQALAGYYGLPFELGVLGLGEEASEEQARTARHAFLRETSRKYQDGPIATAHHSDDLIETAIINTLRGTGRHGISSLQPNETYLRPLLEWNRQHISDYAGKHRLEWVEDETNATERFLRNRVRHQLVPQLKQTGSDRELLCLVSWFARHNPQIDQLLSQLLEDMSEQTADHLAIKRGEFKGLPSSIQTALLHYVLRQLQAQEIDRRLVADITAFIRTAVPGKQFTQATPLLVEQSQDWTLFRANY